MRRAAVNDKRMIAATVDTSQSPGCERPPAVAISIDRLARRRLREAPRWWYLLRYHRSTQLVRRAMMLGRRRLFAWLPHGRYLDVALGEISRRENPGFDTIIARQRQLRRCRAHAAISAEDERLKFEFLNERRTLSLPLDWRLQSVAPVSALWRFHLHYHEFLLDLPAAGRAEESHAHELIWAIVDDWIGANPISRPGALSDAWHPFCLSKRIAVWLMIWHACDPPDAMRERFVTSLEAQIRFLERHLEWDLRGNHLLENLRTLALAGAFFDGPVAERRLALAERWLTSQFTEQILPSGEHFERSPMYHAHMLSAVLDVRDAVSCLRPRFAEACREIALRMSRLLRMVTHPDGAVSLLSDTALGDTPSVDVLCDESERGGPPLPATADESCSQKSQQACVAGDYWTWRDGDDWLLFDAGPVGADELPAHAHCDLLGMEASFSRKRVFVDNGVYDYEDGEMRRYCRSTAAHNVLQIDGVEQCDTWSRFRMGYRGRPTALQSGCDGEFHWCCATHNAYRRIGVPVVGRWLACRRGGPWFCIDWAEGRGVHELVHRLHLAPDVAWTANSPRAVDIHLGDRSLTLQSLTESSFTQASGWYCPDFGIRHKAPTLTLSAHGTLPAVLGWMICDSSQRDTATLTITEGGGDMELVWRNGETSASLSPPIWCGQRGRLFK